MDNNLLEEIIGVDEDMVDFRKKYNRVLEKLNNFNSNFYEINYNNTGSEIITNVRYRWFVFVGTEEEISPTPYVKNTYENAKEGRFLYRIVMNDSVKNYLETNDLVSVRMKLMGVV